MSNPRKLLLSWQFLQLCTLISLNICFAFFQHKAYFILNTTCKYFNFKKIFTKFCTGNTVLLFSFSYCDEINITNFPFFIIRKMQPKVTVIYIRNLLHLAAGQPIGGILVLSWRINSEVRKVCDNLKRKQWRILSAKLSTFHQLFK